MAGATYKLKQKDKNVFTEERDCWNFKGFKTKRGYGSIKRNGKSHRAHKYFYEEYVGKYEDGLVLDHLCRNTSCVNPSHLEPVTVAVNTQRGNTAKLDDEKVDNMFQLRKEGATQYEIAELFGVGQGHVSRVLRGKRWQRK